MIAIMIVSADGENVYYIHLPEYAGAADDDEEDDDRK